MKTTKEKIAVMQAFTEGKIIEYSVGGQEWYRTDSPSWDWIGCDYRVRVEKVKLYYITYLIDSLLMFKERDQVISVNVLQNTDRGTLYNAIDAIKKCGDFVCFLEPDIQEIEI